MSLKIKWKYHVSALCAGDRIKLLNKYCPQLGKIREKWYIQHLISGRHVIHLYLSMYDVVTPGHFANVRNAIQSVVFVFLKCFLKIWLPITVGVTHCFHGSVGNTFMTNYANLGHVVMVFA